jgi:hypothetical protein
MANYKAVASGNWSALATWQDNSSGSFIASTVLPGASDVVYSNNFTVTIDQDIMVSSIRNTAATGIVQSGSFSVTASRNLTFTGIGVYRESAGVPCLIVNAPAQTVNIVGNIQHEIGSPVSISVLQVLGVNCVVNLTGNVFSNTAVDIRPTILEVQALATVNIVGNLFWYNTRVNEQLLNNKGTVNITGNCINYQGGTNNAILSGKVNVVGEVRTNGAGAIIHNLQPPSSVAANLTMSGAVVLATTNWTQGIQGGTFVFTSNTQNSISFKTELNTNQVLYTPGVATGHPATTNVRTGIVYGPTNNLTGTCAVPPAAAVSLGVPVDNTVGTASLDANALAAALNTSLSASLPTPISASLQASLPTPISASLQASLPTPIATALNTSLSASLPAAIAPLLWDESVTNITTPNSIGERLKNCSTVATTGAQIASFNP